MEHTNSHTWYMTYYTAGYLIKITKRVHIWYIEYYRIVLDQNRTVGYRRLMDLDNGHTNYAIFSTPCSGVI